MIPPFFDLVGIGVRANSLPQQYGEQNGAGAGTGKGVFSWPFRTIKYEWIFFVPIWLPFGNQRKRKNGVEKADCCKVSPQLA